MSKSINLREYSYKRRYSREQGNDESLFLSLPDIYFQHSIRKPAKKEKVQEESEELYSWVLLGAVVIFYIITGYSGLCFGMYYVTFTEVFNTTKAAAGFINSIFAATSSFCSLFSSVLIDLYGVKKVAFAGCILSFIGIFSSAFAPNIYTLYVCYGFISGVGLSFTGLSASVIIQQHFYKHRNVATSVSMCGIPTGNFISPFITNFFLHTFGWRGAIMMQSSILLHTLCISLLFSPTKKSMKEHKKLSKSSSNTKTINVASFCTHLFDCSLLKSPAFVLFIFGVLLARFNLIAFVDHTPSRAVHSGEDLQSAGYLLTLFCLGNFSCRVLCSIIMALTKYLNPLLIYTLVVLCQSLLSFALTFCRTYLAVAICTTIFGCFQGFMAPNIILSTVKLAGVQKYARARALCNVIGAIGNFAATPLTGFIFDLTQNYDSAFYFSSLLGFIGALLLFIACFISLIQKRKNSAKAETTELEEEEFYKLEVQRIRTFTC